jgi:CBS domain-containing protein
MFDAGRRGLATCGARRALRVARHRAKAAALRPLNARPATQMSNRVWQSRHAPETTMPATLESLATPIVVTANPETTAARAAQLMRKHHVGSLVVVDSAADDDRPVGIVTDRDLVLAVMAEGLDPSLFTVGDIMSLELVTAPASADLLDATLLLRRHLVRRLIVLDDAGRVVGLAALEDLLEALTREFGDLVLALRGARDREVKERR